MPRKLTVEAERQIERASLNRREVARRMNTSLPQLYRLLDRTNKRKSPNQVVALLHVLDCEVKVEIRQRSAA